ncbi:MAG: hypothetical protein A2542_01790 [Parcubacteria group bacterium RIFOXYD2_FULL_52_8]|nr:MAG: hypothetical protein A2542_01790 [Parcubacteria group bacterium RIFOXYD2_FULL_52_8]
MADTPYINYFAEADSRGKRIKFGIKVDDRAKHFYVIGKSGLGKSTLLENLAIQDIQHGEGLAFIDPHGGTAEKLLDYIPAERLKDVVYFAPHDLEFPIAFNILEDIGKDKRYLVANGLMATFKKIWPDVWSARMEYILNNVLLALLEYPGSTILGVNRMLSDAGFRAAVVNNLQDPSVRAFWVDEFANYTERMAAESVPAIQNKIGQFTSNPLIRNIIGQAKSTFDIRDVMDKKKILIMNLSKGRVGEINANLLGGMLITKLYLAAMSRADASAAEMRVLPPLYFYVDEFQSFVNDTFADILSEARKYKLALTIAHQYIEQMPETVRDAVFGNVGTTVCFRVGPLDAEIMEKLFAPKFTVEDIVNLGKTQVYLTMMIDGVGSAPFSARTIPPIPPPAESYRNLVIENSRACFSRPRAEVEKGIGDWLALKFEQPASTFSPGGGGERSRPIRRKPEEGSRESRPREGHGDRPSRPPGASSHARPRSERASVPDTVPLARPAAQSLSLKALGGVRGETAKNLNELRNTLKDVLQKSGAPVREGGHAENTPAPSSGSKKAEPRKQDFPPVSQRQEQAPSREVPTPPQKKEVPEDVLRGLLNVEMPPFDK